MAKKIIPEELDLLIQEYLTDGILTDKGRQVILKELRRCGLNRDEIDLYLDAPGVQKKLTKLMKMLHFVVRKESQLPTLWSHSRFWY